MERRQTEDDWLYEAANGREEQRVSARVSRLFALLLLHNAVLASIVTKEDDEATEKFNTAMFVVSGKIPVNKQVAAGVDGDQKKLELEESSPGKTKVKDISHLKNGFICFSGQLLNINLALDGHLTRVATRGEGFPKTEFPPQIPFVTRIFFYSATHPPTHTHTYLFQPPGGSSQRST